MWLIAAAAIILSVAEGEDDEEGDEEKEDSFGLLSNGFNADSLSLQVAGISEEIVREYTKLILDVEKGVCSDENPEACCRFCNIRDTCRAKCGNVTCSGVKTLMQRFCCICTHLNKCDTLCKHLYV